MDKWDDVLHDDMQFFLDHSGKYKLILVPRGHFKSSIVTVGWCIQQILINPNESILIRNAVWDFSRELLAQISNYLQSPTLTSIFGQFCLPSSTWTKEVIEIAQKTDLVNRQPTITTAGLETALTGRHFTTIIDDDLVGQQNVTTKEQIQKVITVYEDSENLLNPGGKHIIIGTRWANKDLYGHLLNTDTKTVNLDNVDRASGSAEPWRETYMKWVSKKR